MGGSTGDTDKVRFEGVLDAMLAKARDMGVGRGVAAVVHLGDDKHIAKMHSIHYKALVSIERRADPNRGKDDTGTNYLGVVLMKIAYAYSTWTDSGSGVRPLKYGETEYRGCIIIKDESTGHYWLLGFSGAAQDDDVVISRSGAEYIRERTKDNPEEWPL